MLQGSPQNRSLKRAKREKGRGPAAFPIVYK
jgi:hypothetical protein